MKKIFALALAAVMSLSLVACGGGSSSTASSGGSDANASTSVSTGTAVDLPEIAAGSCETPAIVTSAGQSADVDIAMTLCSKAGIDVTKNATITADELTSDCKTLIVAVGGSSKGLGAAGIDADQELERVNAVLDKAESEGITVLVMHTGGSARRGTLSDSFITPTFAKADMAIVVSEGDSDGLMAGILAENNTPSTYVEQASDCLTVLQTIFGL